VRLIHLDAVGGIAGDMFVAAMLDAFPDLKTPVLADARAVLPANVGEPALDEGMSGGVRVLRFGLKGGGALRPKSGSFREHVARVRAAGLGSGVAAEAEALLTILAEAEAKIHGVPVEEVHFHELADWDSLLDVVAAGSIIAHLEGAQWSVSPLPRGSGVVKTAHGMLPVPAPATALILEGFSWRDDGIAGERVTPTGAAILKHIVSNGLPGESGRLKGSGSGAGTRDLPGMPNILRALVFEQAQVPTGDRVTVVAFEVDDMTGEEIGVASDRLRAMAGVLDLSIAQRFGKKGRPMQSFQLVVSPDASDAVIRRCFVETSTIGLRVAETRRVVLPRETATLDGIGVKSVFREGLGRTAKAESDDLHEDSLTKRRSAKRKVESESR
jgi:pyridinium-3,5-bisthiocarboxylic acid mononucleotide nickel chelatase